MRFKDTDCKFLQKNVLDNQLFRKKCKKIIFFFESDFCIEKNCTFATDLVFSHHFAK